MKQKFWTTLSWIVNCWDMSEQNINSYNNCIQKTDEIIANILLLKTENKEEIAERKDLSNQTVNADFSMV